MREISLAPHEELLLQKWANGDSNPRLALRAKVILALADKKPVSQVAREFSIDRKTVRRWGEKFLEERLEALPNDAPRIGRKPKETTPSPEGLMEAMRNETPGNGSDWTYDSLAVRFSTPQSTIKRQCKKHKIPLTKDDLKMKLYLDYHHPVTNIGGDFVDPVIQVMAFHLDCVDWDSLMVNGCSDDAHNPRVSEMFATRYQEFENEMTRLMLKMEGRQNRKSDLDVLRFLDKLKRGNPGGKEILLIISSMAADTRDRISRYIDQHPQFHFRTWATPDSWLSQVRGVIDSVEDRYKRVMFHELENILADYAMYDIGTGKSIRPFVSIIKHRK